MKPILLKIDSSTSYSCRAHTKAFLVCSYYYHPQVEIVYFEKSDGICIIGDKIHNVKQGDIFLLGKNLPHLFKNDERFANIKLQVKIFALHFLEDFWGDTFLNLIDMQEIKTVLKKARRGIQLHGKTKMKVANYLNEMVAAKGSDRILLLIKTLNEIANSKDTTTILPIGFEPLIDELKDKRINDIYSYLIENFYNKINIKEISKIAHLSEHSFCRYFKTKTGKTYTNFLNEIRIKHACKLLTETKFTTDQIINQCGFVNSANFFRHFKKLTGTTPAGFTKINSECLIKEK